MRSRMEQAAYNNAHWCNAVCGAQGRPGEFRPGLWLNRRAVPRFYPNVFTFSEALESADVERHLQTLTALKSPNGFSVKDSFARLELTSLGFQRLFEATWLWRTATLPKLERAAAGIHWATVQSEAELERWETAWSNKPAQQEAQPRTFVPALLKNRAIRFMAAYRKGKIIAGVIANHTEDVVGISNIFAPSDDLWADCIVTVIDAFPSLPLVGYEGSSALLRSKFSASRNSGHCAFGYAKALSLEKPSFKSKALLFNKPSGFMQDFGPSAA